MANALTGQALLDDMRRRSDEENERHRRETVYLVEATDFESLTLWLGWSEEAVKYGWGDPKRPRVPWEQITHGFGEAVGRLADMPVFVVVSFARVLGRVIAFYEATSQVVDHRLVDKWLESAFPARRGRTNATNFHICVDELKRYL